MESSYAQPIHKIQPQNTTISLINYVPRIIILPNNYTTLTPKPVKLTHRKKARDMEDGTKRYVQFTQT